MRYFVTGEQHRKSLLNTLVLMFLVYIALLWVSNGMMYFHHMDLTPGSVIAYYLGSEEQFTQPRSYQGMLEVSHFHLFSMGMLVSAGSLGLLFPPSLPLILYGIVAGVAIGDLFVGGLLPGFVMLALLVPIFWLGVYPETALARIRPAVIDVLHTMEARSARVADAGGSASEVRLRLAAALPEASRR